MKAYLIMYDITRNKIRNDVIKALKRNGFYRIQKSVFLGGTTRDKIKELEELFDIMLQDESAVNDKYIIVPLDASELRRLIMMNIHLDIELYLGSKSVHFV